jgi:hypothetical protein
MLKKLAFMLLGRAPFRTADSTAAASAIKVA